MKKCVTIEDGRDTGGLPILIRKCFCGTTACTQQDKPRQPRLDEYGIDQEAFYKKALG